MGVRLGIGVASELANRMAEHILNPCKDGFSPLHPSHWWIPTPLMDNRGAVRGPKLAGQRGQNAQYPPVEPDSQEMVDSAGKPPGDRPLLPAMLSGQHDQVRGERVRHPLENLLQLLRRLRYRRSV